MEQQLSDTFVVAETREIALPVIGPFVVRGVLRSELEGRLTQEIGRFIRAPVVRARPLVRVSVQGGVNAPGFYSLPGDAVLSDVLMAASGPARESRVAKLRIERNGERVWEGDALQRALAEGRTLDDMSLRGGDQFIVPERSRTSDTIRTVGIALSIPVTVFTLIRLF
jgi:protein involved in polysaccharide export with SLBB domain